MIQIHFPNDEILEIGFAFEGLPDMLDLQIGFLLKPFEGIHWDTLSV